MFERTTGQQRVDEELQQLSSTRSGARDWFAEMLLGSRWGMLTELLEGLIRAVETKDRSELDPDAILQDLRLAYEIQLQQLGEARSYASETAAEEGVTTTLGLFRRLASPIALLLTAGAIGGAIGAGGATWPMIALLVAVATAVAWLAKIEHDRRYGRVLESAREASNRAAAALNSLDAALNG